MSYDNALVLLELASFVSAHRHGVTYPQIQERMRVQRRQAQRLMGFLGVAFPELDAGTDDDGRMVFRLLRPQLCDLAAMTAEQLAALEHAIDSLARQGETSRPLMQLRDHVEALIPASRAGRILTDSEALAEAQGFVARPGPREVVDPKVGDVIVSAILECRLVVFDYASGAETAATPRRVKPLGLLSGLRRYLVALPDAEDAEVRTYRLDKIAAVELLPDWFARPEGFDLDAYSRRGFGAFQAPDEWLDVVWRFRPDAAERARGWTFHPDQVLEDQPDGSLLVRFKACGHLEMAWHLYCWGDKVEVLEPVVLRTMVEGHRRSDFAAMP